MVIVGIVGNSLGKYGDVMTAEIWDGIGKSFIEIVNKEMEEHGTVSLVSGGCSGIDHLAVQMFLDGRVQELTLCLPCQFVDGRYEDTGSPKWFENPGRTLNAYHKTFSTRINRNTLDDLKQCFTKGAHVQVYKGFHSRNTQIALQSEKLFAYTTSISDQLIDGGTLDTWNKAKCSKQHISILSISK